MPNPDNTVENSWDILALPCGSPAPTAITTGFVTTNSNTYTLLGLTPSTCYDIYVRAECSSTDSSFWSLASVTTSNPPPISTDTTQYTPAQLVQNVLINSNCAQVSNITYSTGTNFGSTNGIGYFNQNGSTFPFNNGVILTSGNALNAPGPNTTTLSDGSTAWTGDTDLENIILNATGNVMNSYNATKLEFDFVPLISNLSFNFIFASEEYGTFQCAYSDAFAFLLTDIATGVTTNIAVVPNTTTPISVVTIRDALYNNGCASQNPQYFGAFYNTPNGLSPNASPTNFNGRTVPLTAASTVIPGHQYHIKLVVADRQDTAYDSAVFIEGGSFNIGNINLGSDLLVANNTALCYGSSHTINSNLDPTQFTFTWTLNGNVIPNEIGPTITVTQGGTYGIIAQYVNTTCAINAQILVETYQQITPGTPVNLNNCSASAFAQFDLSQNNSNVLGNLNPATYSISYYESNADAIAGTNPLSTLYTNTVPSQQTIYVTIKDNQTGCFEVRSFTINVINQLITPTFSFGTSLSICSGGIVPSLTSPSLEQISGNWSSSLVDNTNSASYTFTPNAGQCAVNTTFNVTIYSLPIVSASNVSGCSGSPITLVGSSTSSGGSGTYNLTNPYLGTNSTTYTYTFTDTNGCTTTSSPATITINPLPIVSASNVSGCQGSSISLVGSSSSTGGTESYSIANPYNGSSTTYTYTYTDGNGCTATSSPASITVNPRVTPTFSPITSLCNGQTPIPILPSVSLEQFSGIWTPAAIDNTQTSNYTFTPNPNQCANNSSLQVIVYNSFDFTLSGECVGNNFIASVTPINQTFDLNTVSYIWQLNNTQIGTSNTFDVTNYINSLPATTQPTYPLNFSVTITTQDGCYMTHPISFASIFCGIQKGISVNGDGLNDLLDLSLLNVKHLSIYNRYGSRVYSKERYTNEWKGQSDSGEDLPDGTYYYIIDFNDNQPSKNGWIYVAREN